MADRHPVSEPPEGADPPLERLGLPPEGIKNGAVSGFATGLFSIPEGMAYAQLAGVDPVFGLYSGMVATLVASLTTGTVLMISTLTSAIALATGSALDVANVTDADLPAALFTLTFLTGAVMLVLGLLRLGSLVDFVSNAVMTGFVVGASLLIIVGELGDFSGYEPEGGNKLAEIVDWFAHVGDWDAATTAVAATTVLLMLALKAVEATEKLAAVLTLVAMTVVVAIVDPSSVALVRDIADIPNSLPSPDLPSFALVPDLALGAVSVALVALVQGAGISTAYPNPGRSTASQSRDFVGEGLGNVAGSFFQSLGTGGSLSRTGISVSAGATSRWGGVFAAVWLGLLVLAFGGLAELVPLSVIAGLLFVIAGELIMSRLPAVALVVRSSASSLAAMVITFATALFIPLQWTIFLGAGLSLALFLGHSHARGTIIGLHRNEDGRWEEADPPERLRSHEVTVVEYRGSDFFAEVPQIHRLLPAADDAQGAALVVRVRDLDDMHSTGLTLLTGYVRDLRAGGNHLVLEGVRPGAMATMERTGVIDVVGRANVIPAHPALTQALDEAWTRAQTLIAHPEGDDDRR